MSTFVQTGGQVPNDGSSQVEVITSFTTATGTTVDGTSDANTGISNLYTFTAPSIVAQTQSFSTLTTYIGLWDALADNDIWNSFTRTWENS